MAKMPKEVMDMLNNPQSAKVLATCDSSGKLNAVPKGSLTAVDDETVAFADIFGDKTNANLKATNKAVVSFFSPALPPVGFQVKGTFQGFQTSGPMFDQFAQKIKELLKMDIKAVGVIKVDEVYATGVPKPGAKLA